jgi:threonine synthase
MWKFDAMLPPVMPNCRIQLGEGQTPLVKSRSIGAALGLKNLYFKLENLNPSGSYKDRFASAFVSMMKMRSQSLCVATSSGNTGAALAAYCAAANIKCVLAIVDGAPIPKIKQMQLYGAHTIMVEGFGINPNTTSEVFAGLAKLTNSLSLPLPISAYIFCAEGMRGVQSIMYEIVDSIEAQHVFSPAGGGGLTLAMAKGALEYSANYKKITIPKVHCVQPEGNDTIASALRNGFVKANAVNNATTQISGLQVPSVLDGDLVIEYCRKLNGNGFVVKDSIVFEYQKLLAQTEGIFCEPAGAVSLAGLKLAVELNEVHSDETVVCLITGSGFKDMLSVDNQFNLPAIQKIDSTSLIKQIQLINN